MVRKIGLVLMALTSTSFGNQWCDDDQMYAVINASTQGSNAIIYDHIVDSSPSDITVTAYTNPDHNIVFCIDNAGDLKKASDEANIFIQEIDGMSGNPVHSGNGGDTPNELYFSFTVNIIDPESGSNFNLVLGQGGYDGKRNWWLGCPTCSRNSSSVLNLNTSNLTLNTSDSTRWWFTVQFDGDNKN